MGGEEGSNYSFILLEASKDKTFLKGVGKNASGNLVRKEGTTGPQKQTEHQQADMVISLHYGPFRGFLLIRAAPLNSGYPKKGTTR